MEESIIQTAGCNNCASLCLIKCHVKDGKVVKITTETKEEANGDVVFAACPRGINYHTTYLSDRRLQYPMKRVGKRGSGEFVRISWDEAIAWITREWIRIRDTYGPGSRHVMHATAECGALSGRQFAKRLLALDGGFLDYYNSYSCACSEGIVPYVYGDFLTGNSPEDWLNSSLIVLWGHNPAETKFGNATMFYLRRAKAAGIDFISIDPRKNKTCKELDCDWYPVRPDTDAALADAIAYELFSTGRYDRHFIETYCQGFTPESLPAGVPEDECYFAYLSGKKDGIAKTPEWGASVTGLPAERIRELAGRMWEAKPCNIIQGWGPQRHANGEQAVRGAIALCALLGSIGIPGGSAAGVPVWNRHAQPALPIPPNPFPFSIPSFLWCEAADHGTDLTIQDGLRYLGCDMRMRKNQQRYPEGINARLDQNIKMILNLGGNCLINQHSDVNRSRAVLEDESKIEFIVVSDVFMTPSARYADLLLPCTSFLEENNFPTVMNGNIMAFSHRVVEPMYESRPEYEWLKQIAANIGLYDAFTEGHETAEDWLEDLYGKFRVIEPELPAYNTISNTGIYRYKDTPIHVAFRENIEHFESNPFQTSSGKIDIFSKDLYEMDTNQFISAIPRYIPGPDGPEDPSCSQWPLQLIGYHTIRRTHSIHDNNPLLEKLDPRAVHMNPYDAEKRGITDGDSVLIENKYGKVMLPAKVTEDIMPGVAAMAQGAWYAPDENGIDHGGCINVLTAVKPTPLSKGNPQHTNRVEIRKAFSVV